MPRKYFIYINQYKCLLPSTVWSSAADLNKSNFFFFLTKRNGPDTIVLGFTAPSNRPTYMVLIWAWCSELGPRYRNRHRSSEGPGEAPPEAVPGEGGGLEVVWVRAGEGSLVVAGDSGDLGRVGASIKFIIYTFTFREFSRHFYPKRFTISTFGKRKRNSSIGYHCQYRSCS